MALYNEHKSGVLLTSEVVGQTLYCHSAACNGRLVKLFITKVGYTHTDYRTEEGDTGTFCTTNCSGERKNWKAISFETAAEEIRHYWDTAVQTKEAELADLRRQQTDAEGQLSLATTPG